MPNLNIIEGKPLRNRKLEREHLIIHNHHTMQCHPPETDERVVVTDELRNDTDELGKDVEIY